MRLKAETVVTPDPVPVEVGVPDAAVVVEDDPLQEAAQQLAEQAQMIDGEPVDEFHVARGELGWEISDCPPQQASIPAELRAAIDGVLTHGCNQYHGMRLTCPVIEQLKEAAG